MRWFVEVTSLGKPDSESVQIDADTWQKALEIARAERGQGGSIAGFSIELMEDGCRAVDPDLRLRYTVRAAVPEPKQPIPAAPVPVEEAPPSRAPQPSPPSRAAEPAPPSRAPEPPPPSRAPEPSPPSVAAPAPSVPPPAVVIPSQPSVPRADVTANVPSQIIFKREQERTSTLPVTYREYVYLVPPGITEADAETLLHAQIELVRTSLARVPPGKLVNLAVFDVAFQGKPPVPPVATLAWKDWRGDPVVGFPRRAQPPPSRPPASSLPHRRRPPRARRRPSSSRSRPLRRSRSRRPRRRECPPPPRRR